MTRPERDDARDNRDAQPERGWSERGPSERPSERGAWMDLALAAYVEPLVRGRTVLFVGEAQSSAASRLGEVAGRLEVVPTGARQRPSRSGRGTLRSHAETGEWDFVWVTEATALVGDAAQLREVAEALSPRGVALFTVEADVEYEALYRGLREQFEHVRMLGQAPFAGQSIVDFAGAQRDTTLSFDGSIVGDADAVPARFLALCGPRAVALDAHAIVQLPAEESASSGEARREVDAARGRLEHSERRLEQAQREIARTGQKLDELRHELARAQGGLAKAEAERVGAEERARAEAAKAGSVLDRAARAESSLATVQRALAEAQSDSSGAEVAALESALHARAQEIVALKLEVSRRGTLVRDILESRGAVSPPSVSAASVGAPSAIAPSAIAPALSVASPPVPEIVVAPAPLASPAPLADDTVLRDALIAAQRGAVDAEAAKAAALFARDEALAAADRVRAERRDEVVVHARDAGRARGLLARVAELEELRGLLEARAELLQADLREASHRLREAQRETELVREQYELAVAQARAIESARTEDARRSGALVAPSAIADAVTAALAEASLRSEAALGRAEAQIQEAETARARADEEAVRLRTSLELFEAQATRDKAEAHSLREELEATLAAERHMLEQRIEALGLTGARESDALRGEVTGLRFLVADLEAARDARAVADEDATVSVGEENALLRDRLERLTASHRASLELQQMTAARADAETSRALELAQRVLALDGLVARLQSVVAQESERSTSARRGLRALEVRVNEAVEARDALQAVEAVRVEEDRRAAADRESRLATTERDLVTARELASLLRQAIGDTRSLLTDAAARLPASGTAERGQSGDPALRERLDEMRIAIEDRDILLRSLTAQLQDKDDRVRGLEAMLREGPQGGEPESLAAAVAERDERIARLRGELDEVRASHARLEAMSGGAREREAELRRLQSTIVDRDALLMSLEGRAVAAERDLAEVRKTFAAARAELELVLADTRVGAGTSSELGDHVAELLRLLRRF